MSIAERTRAVTRASPRSVARPQPRESLPVTWAAVLGALCCLGMVYVFADWIISGQAVRTPNGVSHVPGWLPWASHGLEVICVAATLTMGYVLIWRPWRQTRTLTLDGMLLIATLQVYWIDPISAYFKPFWTYNTTFVQLGSWLGQFPGAYLPHASRFSEPIVVNLGVYAPVFFGGMFIGRYVMNKARQRNPHVSKTKQILICYVTLSAVDLAMEIAFVRFGFYAFPGALGPTVWKGHYYQFPVVEAFMWGLCWTMMATLRYFKNDRGETLAERGSERLGLTTGKRTAVRLLAIIGAMNVILVLGYDVPAWIAAAHSGTWNNDYVTRSYLTNSLCGPGTTYACYQAGVPIPRGTTSVHIAPDGTVVVPSGTTIRDQSLTAECGSKLLPCK